MKEDCKYEEEEQNLEVSLNSSIFSPASPLWLTAIECIPWCYHEIRHHVSYPNRHTVPTNIRFLLRMLHGMEPILDLVMLRLQLRPRNCEAQRHYRKIHCYKEWLQWLLQNTLLYHQVYSWRGQHYDSNGEKMIFLPLLPHLQDSDFKPTGKSDNRLLPPSGDQRGNPLNGHHTIFIGPRTGKRIGGQGGTDSSITKRKVTWNGVTCICLSEFLHYLRFPLWTSVHGYQQNQKKKKGKTELFIWFFTLFIDITSIQLLRQGLNMQLVCKTNTLLSSAKYRHNQQQLQLAYQLLTRRKLRLWLYIIKSPLWESITRPLVRKVCHLLSKLLPLIGSSVEQYLLSWIEYYQTHHTYLLEQEYY